MARRHPESFAPRTLDVAHLGCAPDCDGPAASLDSVNNRVALHYNDPPVIDISDPCMLDGNVLTKRPSEFENMTEKSS